jgi:protocatechuate 3,4-dioxygenase beta subunit
VEKSLLKVWQEVSLLVKSRRNCSCTAAAEGERAVNPKLIGRREAIQSLSVAGAAFAIGCGGSPTDPSATSSISSSANSSSGSTSATPGATATTSTAQNTACATTPNETAGPYPSLTDLFRSDVREDRQGTRLDLAIRVVNVSSGCTAVPNANVEIWHCDVAGNYSEYGTTRNATFLRGIQTTDGNGEAKFTTIYPGWYQGRATHIHLEVTMNGVTRKTTQIAFPESINNTVYRSGVYASRGANPTANAADGIFADSLSSELVTPAGDVSGGFTASFQIGI